MTGYIVLGVVASVVAFLVFRNAQRNRARSAGLSRMSLEELRVMGEVQRDGHQSTFKARSKGAGFSSPPGHHRWW